MATEETFATKEFTWLHPAYEGEFEKGMVKVIRWVWSNEERIRDVNNGLRLRRMAHRKAKWARTPY